MLVSRPLSLFRKAPSSLSKLPPPEGPFSGHFVVKDEAAEAEDSYCWGICKRKKIKKPPFPQDRILTILHSSSQYEETTKSTKVWFIPVLDRPLSSNRYYLIKAQGKHKGLVLNLFFFLLFCVYYMALSHSLRWLFYFYTVFYSFLKNMFSIFFFFFYDLNS